MADVFISYAREDRPRAEQVARGLSALGMDSFWDTDIPPGQTWADYIEGKLTQCKIVVVLWTEHSTKSQWVREEARMGRDKSKLIPVRLDSSPAPFGFGEVQAADLSTWRGQPDHPEWVRFAAAVRSAIGAPSEPSPQAPPQPQAQAQAQAPLQGHEQPQPQPQAQSGWRTNPQPAPSQHAHASSPAAQAVGGEPGSPNGYIQKCFRMYVNGAGRARRAEYWWWFLFVVIASIVAGIVDIGVGGINPYTNQPNSQFVSMILSLALICPNVSLMSRRLHDIGWSGWMAAAIYGAAFVGGFLAGMMNPMGSVLFLLAGVGALVVGVIPSAAGPNQHGPNPKGL